MHTYASMHKHPKTIHFIIVTKVLQFANKKNKKNFYKSVDILGDLCYTNNVERDKSPNTKEDHHNDEGSVSGLQQERQGYVQ